MSDAPRNVEVPLTEDHIDIEVKQEMVHIPFPESFVYSNCCAFGIGQVDIRLGFAEIMPDGKAVPRVGIVMPPEAAAVIALVMLQQVKAYEQSFGEIRHPIWKAMKEGKPLDINLKAGTVGIPLEPPPTT